MDLSGKTALVLGLGKTGLAVCEFLQKRKAYSLGIEDRPRAIWGPKIEQFVAQGGRVYSTDEFLNSAWETIDFLILSPGIPLTHPIVQEAQKRKIPYFGEIEFASSFNSSKIVAVTGTNGKSTTTELIGGIFRKAGLSVSVGGNLGTPWVALIDQNPYPEWTILEVSSFQLETIENFHPQLAVLLNITEDHLDRHPTLEAYAAAKAKIFKNQTAEDALVYNAGDVHILKLIPQVRSRIVPFSSTQKVSGIFWKSSEEIESSLSGKPEIYSLQRASLEGLHNIENMMAAIAIAELAGISQEVIQNVLENFRALPHRLEWIREVNEVEYYDDSKGTNVGAVAMSLASFEKPVVLILGGKDKGGDYQILKSLIKHKCRAVLLMGEAKEKIRKTLEGALPLHEVSSMREAVQKASVVAKPGDVVLLSPACSSFDMFRDYKHRGEEFQKNVREL